jgi:hypothetical protein
MKAFFLYIYNTFIFTPLAGGNGKIQTAELAQWILMIMIISASIKEGKSPEQIYPDVYWICIFGAMCAIAAIKPAFGKKEVKSETEP